MSRRLKEEGGESGSGSKNGRHDNEEPTTETGRL